MFKSEIVGSLILHLFSSIDRSYSTHKLLVLNK